MLSTFCQTANNKDISRAVECLNNGDIIAFPTETVYGIAADAANKQAIEKIYCIKKRSGKLPLQIMVASFEEAKKIGIFNKNAEFLAQKYWPGPLTIVVERLAPCPLAKNINENNATIGIRIPDHTIALKLLQQYGKPIAVSSANISGMANITTATEVADCFGDSLAVIIDGGISSEAGLPSTVVDCTKNELRILREGAITAKDLGVRDNR